MSTNQHVAILGAGAWGTTLALVAHRAGTRVTLIGHQVQSVEFMHTRRRHPTSLPGVEIPDAIDIVSNDVPLPPDIDAMVIAIPVQQLRTALAGWVGRLPGVPFLSAAKGIDVETLQRPTEIISELMGSHDDLAALSGPNLAGEIAAGKPAVTLVASHARDVAEQFVAALHGPAFRVYLGVDVTGLELGGALKNIVAIGAGMAEGLGAGDNAKASFITRGLAEMTRLGVACGAEAATFAGISGLGDLIATCASPLSRNHRVGLGLARGESLTDVLASLGETAEGVPTTIAARKLARQHGVDAPIIEQMHRVLFESLPVDTAIDELLNRRPTSE